MHCIAGRIGTTSLVNAAHCEEYLEEILSEFRLHLTGPNGSIVLDSMDFTLESWTTPEWTDGNRILQLQMAARLDDEPLQVSLLYEASAGASAIRKGLIVEPGAPHGWILERVDLEMMKLKELVEGVTPAQRFRRPEEGSYDDSPIIPEVDVFDSSRRMVFGDHSKSVLSYWGYNEGLFVFVESEQGEEWFDRPVGLVLSQKMHDFIADGVSVGPALIGGYVGLAEVGFNRYRDAVARYWQDAEVLEKRPLLSEARDGGFPENHTPDMVAPIEYLRIPLIPDVNTRRRIYELAWDRPFSAVLDEVVESAESAREPDPREIAFKARFADYFGSYRHVLGFPDGVNIDGWAYFRDEAGLLILVNPGDSAQATTLPLSEASLELGGEGTVEIDDWSSLEQGETMGKADPADPPELVLAPGEIKIIGINLRAK